MGSQSPSLRSDAWGGQSALVSSSLASRLSVLAHISHRPPRPSPHGPRLTPRHEVGIAGIVSRIHPGRGGCGCEEPNRAVSHDAQHAHRPIMRMPSCHHAPIMPPSWPHHGPITSTRSRPKRRRDHAHAMHTDTRRTPARLTPTSSTWRASPRAPQDWTAQGLRAQGLRPRGWTAPTAARASIASRPLERTRWLCGEGAGSGDDGGRRRSLLDRRVARGLVEDEGDGAPYHLRGEGDLALREARLNWRV